MPDLIGVQKLRWTPSCNGFSTDIQREVGVKASRTLSVRRPFRHGPRRWHDEYTNPPSRLVTKHPPTRDQVAVAAAVVVGRSDPSAYAEARQRAGRDDAEPALEGEAAVPATDRGRGQWSARDEALEEPRL